MYPATAALSATLYHSPDRQSAMHILVVNDDGPPSPRASPYVHSLVRELQAAGHVVSVCLPHTQRSWIGKAHMIGQTVKPLYYRPSPTFDPTPAAADKVQGTTHPRPSSDPAVEEWVLVDSTPATAAGTIGMYSSTTSPRRTPSSRSAPASASTSASSCAYVTVCRAPVTGLS